MVDGLGQAYAGRLQVIKLDFNDAKNQPALDVLAVKAHPTVVLIDRQGVAQPPLIGIQTDEQLGPKVAALLGGGPSATPTAGP